MKLIIHNGIIKTEQGYVEALAAENGRITALGSSDEVMKQVDNDTKTVDLEGKFALPGFNDSHMHFLDVGSSQRKLNLRDAKSVEDVISRGKEYYANNTFEEGSWLEACNWNDFLWEEQRLPTRYDLDQISTEVPIAALRVCGHICIVNSKALELLGIDASSEPPAEGERFDVDENGVPNGILHELFYKVTALIPNPSINEIKKMLLAASDIALAKGLTSVQTDDLETVPTEDREIIIKAYEELIEEGKLKIRINEQCLYPNKDMLVDFYDRGYQHGLTYGDHLFRIGPLKLIGDGSLGGRTAYMLDDYSDEAGNKGLAVYPDEKVLQDIILTAHKLEMPVAVHCIGDAAAKETIDAIEYAMKKYPDIKNRHGIVHAQILNDELCKRMADLDILAYIQPVFIQSDYAMAEDRIGERIKTSYNWRTMRDMGIRLSMGTDCPVEDMFPIENIYSAVTRNILGDGDKPWYKEECLTVEEAVDFYTKASAYASYEEDIKGVLKEGMLADVTVLDKNIYEIEPEEIKNLQVEMTIVGGEVVYSKNS